MRERGPAQDPPENTTIDNLRRVHFRALLFMTALIKTYGIIHLAPSRTERYGLRRTHVLPLFAPFSA
jgi:hypothetical protein